MTRVFVLANLWDIVDLGTDECLDHIQAMGAGGVTLVCTGGPVAQLRTPTSSNPQVFRSSGGFFFQPAEDGYRDTRVKPIVATWCKNRNPLETVLDGCRQRGLSFRLRISAFDVGRLAERHPDSAGQTVFGDRSPLTLCPGDPHVRALLRATCADLADYGPVAIEIDDPEYRAGAFTGDGIEFGWDPNVAFAALLDTCFAKPSRQTAVEAGVDVDAAAEFVRGELEAAMQTGEGPDTSDASWADQAAQLYAYLECQRATLQSLMASAAEAAKAEVAIVSRQPSGAVGIPNLPLPVLPDLDVLNEAVVQVVGIEGTDQAVDETATRFSHRSGVEFGVGEMFAEEPQLLVRACQRAAEQGIPTITLGHYALWPEAADEAVKQAIRFAKRTGE